MSLCLLHAEVPCILQCDKKGHASKKLGTNSVGLASELSLVSKLLRKVIPKEFVRSGVYYDIPLIIVSGLEMSLISGDVRSFNWLPIKDRLAMMQLMQLWFLSALIILLQTTLQKSLSCVLVFMTGKLDQLVPWKIARTLAEIPQCSLICRCCWYFTYRSNLFSVLVLSTNCRAMFQLLDSLHTVNENNNIVYISYLKLVHFPAWIYFNFSLPMLVTR